MQCDAMPVRRHQAFPSGPKSGELPYSPETVKRHFQALRAGLAIYYRGQEDWLEDRILPRPTDPAYANFGIGFSTMFHLFPAPSHPPPTPCEVQPLLRGDA